VVALANSGGDTINFVKQASEFGLSRSQKLVSLLIFLSDIHAIGLQTAQGLMLTNAFYWNLNDGSRAFGKAFGARNNGRMPTMNQAGAYAATLHWMKAIAAMDKAKARDGALVVAKMKEMPTDDPLFGKGRIREDGRTIHDMYLWQVKTPAESKEPYDYLKLIASIPGDEAFRPMSSDACPMLKKTK
jgi:branched-chain amino acid transport system substrate-binding protein